MGGTSKLAICEKSALRVTCLLIIVWKAYEIDIHILTIHLTFVTIRPSDLLVAMVLKCHVTFVFALDTFLKLSVLTFQACLLLSSLHNSQSGSLLTWFESLLCQPPSVSWLHFARKWQQIFHIWYIWLTFGYIWAFLGAGVCSAPERVGLVPTVTHVKVSPCMQPKNIVNAHNATL